MPLLDYPLLIGVFLVSNQCVLWHLRYFRSDFIRADLEEQPLYRIVKV